MSLPQTPNQRLDGKRALVTGASQGIGLAAACALAQAGAAVTLVARSQDKLDTVVSALQGQALPPRRWHWMLTTRPSLSGIFPTRHSTSWSIMPVPIAPSRWVRSPPMTIPP